MIIELTGLRPTLWFADVRTITTQAYSCRKFLFARVVHAGKPLICAMCIVVHVERRQNWLHNYASEFRVRELGLGLSPFRHQQYAAGTGFENVRAAQRYAIMRAWQVLAQARSRELLLHLADMYDEAHYTNWEIACL